MTAFEFLGIRTPFYWGNMWQLYQEASKYQQPLSHEEERIAASVLISVLSLVDLLMCIAVDFYILRDLVVCFG
jgi:hypothetical protein